MKTRIVHTKVWEKDHFNEKSKDAKLLFMYLITNSRINICGAYELADRIILADTGMTKGELEAAKAEWLPKVVFFNGWVFVKNAEKYSQYKGEKNEKARQNELDLLPDNIKKCFIDGVCDVPPIPHAYPIHTVSENTEVVVQVGKTWNELNPAQKMVAFLENGTCTFEGGTFQVQEVIGRWMMATWNVDKEKAMKEMGKFISYWTEPMPSGRKVKWQTEKTFEVKRRLIRWMDNNFGKEAAGSVNNKYQVEI